MLCRPPFCSINTKMASGRWRKYSVIIRGGKASRNVRIYGRHVHAMLRLIYIVLLFPLGRLFSALCVRDARFCYCYRRPWELLAWVHCGLYSFYDTPYSINFFLLFKFMSCFVVNTKMGDKNANLDSAAYARICYEISSCLLLSSQ